MISEKKDSRENKEEKGWDQQRKSDFVDIKLKEGYNIRKIEVVEGSNVESFTITIVDINEKTETYKVTNQMPSLCFI